MLTLLEEVDCELKNHILPFWLRLQDLDHGGFYGRVGFDRVVDKEAPKGAIMTSRILWTFSSAYRATRLQAYLDAARHAYEFLMNQLLDRRHGGLYWMVAYDGVPLDQRKHVYAQAFGVYAFSEYYRASGSSEALSTAQELYRLIESIGYDREQGAYLEEFTREWQEKPNEMLSENGVMASFTMNTHLHVLEAYTNLYRVWPDEGLRAALVRLIDIFYRRIYDRNQNVFKVFFDRNWNSIIDLHSYGHDIEASWLIDDAMHALELKAEDYRRMILDVAYNISECAMLEDGSMANEREGEQINLTRVWWVQAEAMVGFLNAYEHTQDAMFLEKVEGLWTFTKAKIIDHREGGEWFWSCDESGKPSELPIVSPWKANYHNGRFCFEIIRRLSLA